MANIKQELGLINEFEKKIRTGFLTRNVYIGDKKTDEERKALLREHKNAWKIVAKQIDLIWDLPDRVVLLEAKWIMNAKALGQLLCYKELYEEDHPTDTRKIKLGLICKYVDPLLTDVFRKYQIEIYTV